MASSTPASLSESNSSVSLDSLAEDDAPSMASSMTSFDVAPAESLKLVIVCVGLPARGKSYITKKLTRYFNWSQFNTRIFNVGNTRRQQNKGPSKVPIMGPKPKSATSHSASFFDANNKENLRVRESWARQTLDKLLDYLMYEGGNVGIFDATNTTKQRRKWVVESIRRRMRGSVKILFLESICNDAQLIDKNVHLKLMGPDYKQMDPALALRDFRNRLANYEKVYETIDEAEEKENEKHGVQYVKLINAGKKLIAYNISGYLSSQCVFFLLNFNLTSRQIWLSTNGESENNACHIQGGDSSLSSDGWRFSRALARFIGKKRQEFRLRELNRQFVDEGVHSQCENQKFNVWTSTLKRTNETVQHFPRGEYHFKAFKMLNDICYGERDSQGEIRPPCENKLSYRYPGLNGESYMDVIARVRPIIIELERLKDHVLIVSHRVIIRVLLCYFMNLSKDMMTELDVGHGYVYCIEPKPYGLDLKIWQYDEVTDDFYEVNEIEFMQRRRRRFSLGVDSEFRPVLKKDGVVELRASSTSLVFSESEDEGDTTEGSTIDETVYEKTMTGRSDSQSYEFVDGIRRNTSDSSLRSNGIAPMPTRLPGSGTGLSRKSQDLEIARILANEALVERLKEILKDA